MAHQATLNHDPGATVTEVFDEIGGLGNSLVTLGTLQARLAAEDCRESARRALPALITVAILVPLSFASVTVGLVGTAYWVATSWALSPSRAFLIVAAAGLAVSGLLTIVAFSRLPKSFESFRRTAKSSNGTSPGSGPCWHIAVGEQSRHLSG